MNDIIVRTVSIYNARVPLPDLDDSQLKSEYGLERKDGWIINDWSRKPGTIELELVPHKYLIDGDGHLEGSIHQLYASEELTVDNVERFIFSTKEAAERALAPLLA
jgi:hypothetical protein